MLAELGLRAQTEARTLARRFGLLAPLGSLRRRLQALLGRDGYEHAFHDALVAALRPGDVVWDVGANVGLYTELFASSVGDGGTVCAFEPMPSCMAELERRVGARHNVRAFGMALGDAEGTVPLFAASDALGVTHSLVQHALHTQAERIDVRVARGDDLVAAGTAPAPSVLKIDVEGFEEEVLTGLRATLGRPECRSVLIEVHFSILEQRGARHAPARMQRFLAELGYRTRWADASHLVAER